MNDLPLNELVRVRGKYNDKILTITRTSEYRTDGRCSFDLEWFDGRRRGQCFFAVPSNIVRPIDEAKEKP